MLLALLLVGLFGLQAGWILLIGPPLRHATSAVQECLWRNFIGRSLGWFLEMLFWLLGARDAVSRSSVDDFWSIWSC